MPILQHFEFAVMSMLDVLKEKSFPAEIARNLTKTLGRHVTIAQVFTALERLEDKHLVSSREWKPEPAVRGGRRRRVFQLEASGAQAIRDTAATFSRMSSPELHEEAGVGLQQSRKPVAV